MVPGYVDVSLKSESFTSVSPALVQHQIMTSFLARTILSIACKYCFNEVYIIEVFSDKAIVIQAVQFYNFFLVFLNF